MDLGLMKILLKFLNYPLNLSPLYSQPAVPIFLLSLCRSFLTLLLIPTMSFSIVLISLIYLLFIYDYVLNITVYKINKKIRQEIIFMNAMIYLKMD